VGTVIESIIVLKFVLATAQLEVVVNRFQQLSKKWESWGCRIHECV